MANSNLTRNNCGTFVPNSLFASNFSMNFCEINLKTGTNNMIYFESTSGAPLTTYFNFINNTLSTITNLINSFNMLHSFLNSYFSQNFGILFVGYLSISNCYIDQLNNLSSGINAIIFPSLNCINNNSCLIDPYYYEFYSTHICQIKTPPPTSVPPLNPNDLTPCITLPPSPTNCNIESQNNLNFIDVNQLLKSFFLILDLM